MTRDDDTVRAVARALQDEGIEGDINYLDLARAALAAIPEPEPKPEPEPDDDGGLLVDIEATIHQHDGMDWSDDAYNDRAKDLASAITRVVGPTPSSSNSVQVLEILRDLDERMAEAERRLLVDAARFAGGDMSHPRSKANGVSLARAYVADALDRIDAMRCQDKGGADV